MQAILMLAHRDIEQVIEYIDILRTHFLVYIHVDKKFKLSKSIIDDISKKENVFIFQEFEVNWSGWGISAATIFLMKKAMENLDVERFHIISGQHYIGKNIKDIYYFYENNDKIYMTYKDIEGLKKSGEPVILWQKFYFNYDKIKRKTFFGKVYHRINILTQYIFRVNKFKKYDMPLKIYHGSQWMSLPRDVVEYLMHIIEIKPNYMKVFITGYCSEEFWIQTILCNSEFLPRIVNNNYTFIKWEKCYGSYPAILDETDFDRIVQGDFHFIRKVDNIYSQTLKTKIIEKMNI